MIFPTDLLSIFRRHDGIQNPQDAQLAVPAVLQPVVSIPEVLTVGTDQTAAEAQSSTSVHWVETVANAAAIDREVIRLMPGIWEVTLCCAYMSLTTVAADKGEVYLSRDDTNTATTFFRGFSVANTPQRATINFRFAHSDARGIAINFNLTATGVGESHTMDLGIFANRLG